MRTGLKILFAAMTLHMIYVVWKTSVASNLFADWAQLSQIPWMTATVKDFYQTQTPLILWMLYKEAKWLWRIVWLVAFVALGSIATSAYVFIELMKLGPDEPLHNILLRKAAV